MRKTPPSIQIMSAAADPVPGRTEGSMTPSVICAARDSFWPPCDSAVSEEKSPQAVLAFGIMPAWPVTLNPGFSLKASAAFPKNEMGLAVSAGLSFLHQLVFDRVTD